MDNVMERIAKLLEVFHYTLELPNLTHIHNAVLKELQALNTQLAPTPPAPPPQPEVKVEPKPGMMPPIQPTEKPNGSRNP